MATRFQTYETAEGTFGTYDTETENVPTEYISGPYDAVDDSQQEITDSTQLIGAEMEIIQDTAVFTKPAIEGEVI